jgi:hypothetical protein
MWAVELWLVSTSSPQEHGRRAGTENVLLAAALGAACGLVVDQVGGGGDGAKLPSCSASHHSLTLAVVFLQGGFELQNWCTVLSHWGAGRFGGVVVAVVVVVAQNDTLRQLPATRAHLLHLRNLLQRKLTERFRKPAPDGSPVYRVNGERVAHCCCRGRFSVWFFPLVFSAFQPRLDGRAGRAVPALVVAAATFTRRVPAIRAPVLWPVGPADDDLRLPNTLSISFRTLMASEAITCLKDTVAFSAGSACHTGAYSLTTSVLNEEARLNAHPNCIGTRL